MPAVVTSFAGRLYGQRPAKARWLRAVVAADAWTGDAA
jgi:predicted site-specific integrase-resolvase